MMVAFHTFKHVKRVFIVQRNRTFKQIFENKEANGGFASLDIRFGGFSAFFGLNVELSRSQQGLKQRETPIIDL